MFFTSAVSRMDQRDQRACADCSSRGNFKIRAMGVASVDWEGVSRRRNSKIRKNESNCATCARRAHAMASPIGFLGVAGLYLLDLLGFFLCNLFRRPFLCSLARLNCLGSLLGRRLLFCGFLFGTS